MNKIEYTNKILYYKLFCFRKINPRFMHHPFRFTRFKIRENSYTGILFGVQRYSRYSSPLRNGKDGTGRGGSGELVIKEGELGCVPFRGRPVRLKLSNFTPRVPSFLPWLPATLVVCPTDSLR